MADPASLPFLLLAFVCLAAFLIPAKWLSPRWRFEFFALDFGWGALLVALISGLGLDSLSGELGFAERLLVSSNTSLALLVFAGFVFGLGVLLISGALRIIGPALALSVAFSIAAIPCAALVITSERWIFPAIAISALVAAAFTAIQAARAIDPPPPPQRDPRRPVRRSIRPSTKGLLLASLSGVFFGIAAPLTLAGASGDYGLGPYAGFLLFTVATPISVLPFSLFLLNINIDQPPGNLRAYWSRRAAALSGQHRLGFLSGILWAVGTLAYLSQRLHSTPLETDNHATLVAASGLLAAALTGLVFFREASAARARISVLLALALLAVGLLLTAF